MIAFLGTAMILIGALTIGCCAAFAGLLAAAAIRAALRGPRNPPQDAGDIEALIDATREPRTEDRWSARAWAELDALTETAKGLDQ